MTSLAAPAVGGGQVVEFVIDIDGARMTCRDCRADAPVTAGDVVGQVLRFQYLHLGCDPHVQ